VRRTFPYLSIVLALGWSPACNGQRPPRSYEPATEAAVTRPIPVDATYTGIDEPLRILVRTQREWQDLWSRLGANRIPRPSPAPVDFSEEVVVVAAMGTRPTGGHAIRIDSVRYSKDTLWVEVTSVVPGPTCVTTQALTAPVAAVAVERRPNVEGRFIDREEIQTCE
jgi:hypothetical protein